MTEYVEATQIDPGFAPAETAIGWLLIHKGKTGAASDAFNRALKGNPEDASAYFGLGRACAEQGRGELAMDHYTKAIRLEQDPAKKSAIMNHLVKEGNLEG